MNNEHEDDIEPEVSDTAGVETETYEEVAEEAVDEGELFREVTRKGPGPEGEPPPVDVDDDEAGDTI